MYSPTVVRATGGPYSCKLYDTFYLQMLATSFRSSRFFELLTQADTSTFSAEKPCFLSDHNKAPRCKGSQQKPAEGGPQLGTAATEPLSGIYWNIYMYRRL